MLVEAEIKSGADDVRAGDDAQVVEELRRGHGALRSRSIQVPLGDRVEIVRWNVREIRIRLALREKEAEARKSDREFVDDARRERPPVTYRQIMALAEDLAERRRVRKDLIAPV